MEVALYMYFAAGDSGIATCVECGSGTGAAWFCMPIFATYLYMYM